ncbi:MAG: hypothetical protein KAJ03_00970 [Gammaproteobacteria bacterium]|nr:hypothetical protein [Gammaproteobacteria bacterium]
MRECKHLTDSIKGGHAWARKRIKEDEKIKTPNILQQYNLCNHYKTMYHAPFMDDMGLFYECCDICELKPDDDAIFDAMHTGKHGKIVWGKVID